VGSLEGNGAEFGVGGLEVLEIEQLVVKFDGSIWQQIRKNIHCWFKIN
jgi:hypothetical protein